MKRRLKFEQAFHNGLRVPASIVETDVGHSWPDPSWQKDPAKFSYYILGEKTWDKQDEVLNSIKDNQFGIVKAGRKVSKSNTIAKAAIWFVCSFPEAKVVITSATMPQLQQIIWYAELRRLIGTSGTCYDCKIQAQKEGVRPPRPCPHSHVIPGIPAEKAGTGFYLPGSRYIIGRTPKDEIAFQGTSGHSILYLCDEASGIRDSIFTTIEGNLGGLEHGGCWAFLNPNKTRGYCYNKFKKKPPGIRLITIASTDSPNYKEGKTVIPGLANRAYVDKMAREYGVESAEYKIHVLGEYAEGEDGKIINLNSIIAAASRWVETPATGELRIGLDPAGEGGLGDDSVFTVVRGQKMLAQREYRGLTPEGHLSILKDLIAEFGHSNELPKVIVDRDGSVGAPLYRLLRDYSEANQNSFDLAGMRASSISEFDKDIYHLNRDGLWACLSRWIRKGGAIIESERLADELHFPSWTANNKCLLKCTPKKDFIAELKRSPDRADSLALAVWEPTVGLINDSSKQNKPINPATVGDEWWATKSTYQAPPLV